MRTSGSPPIPSSLTTGSRRCWRKPLKACSVCQISHTSTPSSVTVATCRTPPAGGFASRPSLAMMASYWSDVIPGQCMYIATAIPSPPSLRRVQVGHNIRGGHAACNALQPSIEGFSAHDERTGVIRGIERAEIVDALPHAHELDREPELERDCDRDPATR